MRKDRLEDLKSRVKELPNSPGVYLMKSLGEKVIYVGKAKDLRARVRSYFQDNKSISAKTQYLVAQIHFIDYLITKSEVEAFLLEASLIKKHRPKYNIRLKDDKSYPYIKFSAEDDYPRLYIQRKVRADGGFYFGPYTSGQYVRETIRFLNQTFKVRDCSDGFMRTRKRPCLTHQIGRCSAPCVNLIGKDAYREEIDPSLDFLRGRDKRVIKNLKLKMKSASNDERYEVAAKLRDSIHAISAILEKQTVINNKSELDLDTFGFFGDERGTLIEILHIRSGRVIGNQSQFLPKLNCQSKDEDPKEWLTSFINQYYSENIVPDQILVPVDLTDDIYRLLRDVFKERKQKQAQILHALNREQKSLMDLANSNASLHFNDQVNKQSSVTQLLSEIQLKLQLPSLPVRMECFDISNFQGTESVGSQVVFENGTPLRQDYRRYKVKTVEGSNDFASLKEVLERRFRHTEYEDPQLVVIDGGKGQLNKVVAALKEIGRSDVACVGMAKARSEADFSGVEVQSSEERFFIPGRSNPVTFARNSEALNILVALRDEAHRFAISYHRKLRDKKLFTSELDEIEGIGESRKRALLKHFGSVEAIRQANVAEIATVKGMNETIAELVKSALLKTLGESE